MCDAENRADIALTSFICAGTPGYAAMEFQGGRVQIRGCSFGIELKNGEGGSIGIQLNEKVERVVVVANDMLGSAVVSDVPSASTVVEANLM